MGRKTGVAETLTLFLELELAIRQDTIDTVCRRLAESHSR